VAEYQAGVLLFMEGHALFVNAAACVALCSCLQSLSQLPAKADAAACIFRRSCLCYSRALSGRLSLAEDADEMGYLEQTTECLNKLDMCL